jgi:anti-sigma factor RsiW
MSPPPRDRVDAVAGTEHPGDLLSAYIDGALDAHDTLTIEAHVATCAECADAVAGERDVRQAVRNLRAVDVPAGFFERIIEQGPRLTSNATRSRARFAAANIVAAAAVWVGVIGFAHIGGDRTVRPSLTQMASAYSSLLAGVAALQPLDPTEAVNAGVPPRIADRFTLVSSNRNGTHVDAAYRDGVELLALSAQPGRLDHRSLPATAQPMPLASGRAWETQVDGVDMLVMQRAGMVIVVVGPRQPSVDGAIGTVSPRPSAPSVRDRVEAAGRGLLETFGMAS